MKKIGNIISKEEKKAGVKVCYISYIPEFSSFTYSKRIKFEPNVKYKTDLLCRLPEGVLQTSTGYFTETTNMIKIKEKKVYEEKELFKMSKISHNFSVFKHENKYYGIGGTHFNFNNLDELDIEHLTNVGAFRKRKYNGLYLLTSEDCIHWSEPKLILNNGLFSSKVFCSSYDSQACIFYNNNDNFFYMYHRFNPRGGIRKLVLLKSKTINDWSKHECTIVKTEEDLNIYTGYIFLKNNKFYGIVIYYHKFDNTGYPKSLNIGLIQSLDGINFKLKKKYFGYEKKIFPVMNSLQEINDETFVSLSYQDGRIYNLKIDLN